MPDHPICLCLLAVEFFAANGGVQDTNDADVVPRPAEDAIGGAVSSRVEKIAARPAVEDVCTVAAFPIVSSGAAVESVRTVTGRDGGWSYTYSHLDPKTQALFTEGEWARRNQFLSELSPGELSSVRVHVDIASEEPAEVAVYRTFKNGFHNVRDPLFVYEDGMWKHRLVSEELDPFLVELSYEEFVSYYRVS